MTAALSLRRASTDDIPAILALQLSVEADQATRFGSNRWTTKIGEASVTRGLKSSRMLVAVRRNEVVAALRMATKKPWAIDPSYFTSAARAVYLHDVSVEPKLQRSGVGRRLLEYAKAEAREWPVDAIRLDAYDGPSGGGAFYAKCGFAKVGGKIYRSVPLVYYELVLSQ